MQTPVERHCRFRFGLFEVDPGACKLYKRGRLIHLQEQPFQVLSVLLDRAGELVTREELKQVLWPTGIVVEFDESLNTAMKKLRIAVGDSAENPSFIETVPRRGYRFLAPVVTVFQEDPELILLQAESVQSSNGFAALPAVPTQQEEVARYAVALSWRRWIVLGVLALSVACGFFWWTRVRPSPRADLREQQLTRNSSDNAVSGVAISGDGKYLAFADITGLHLELLQTGEVRDIPPPPEFRHGHVNWAIVWLPDSTRFLAVAFAMGRPPSTWQASVMGGVLRLVRDDAIAWAVSSDGSSIVFTTARGGEMWLLDVTGQSPRKLFDAGEHNYFTHAQWSPDGTRLLYIKHVSSAGRFLASMETRALNGGTAGRLLSDTRLRSLHWLRDGRILYVLGEPGLNGASCNYWLTRLEPGGEAFSEKPAQLTHSSGYCMDSTSATTDGKQVAFLKRSSQFSVYFADLSPDATQISPPKHLTLTEGQEWPAAWTLDSQAVIFVSNRDGNWGFYRQSLNAHEATPILTGLASGGLGHIFPRLSPDGFWLLYAPAPPDYTPGSTFELMRVPMTGGTPEVILKAAMVDTPRCAVAPASLCAITTLDQGQLVFTSFDPLLGRGGHELARFKIGVNASYTWALSPDGRRIAILKQSTAQIDVLTLGTQADHKITVQGWNNLMSLDWTADGKGLFTSSMQPSSVLLHVSMSGETHVL
jgi:DNA-binding winged helix-turn-helix (wHTH) protein/Tol biopolymer transport system component